MCVCVWVLNQYGNMCSTTAETWRNEHFLSAKKAAGKFALTRPRIHLFSVATNVKWKPHVRLLMVSTCFKPQQDWGMLRHGDHRSKSTNQIHQSGRTHASFFHPFHGGHGSSHAAPFTMNTLVRIATPKKICGYADPWKNQWEINTYKNCKDFNHEEVANHHIECFRSTAPQGY